MRNEKCRLPVENINQAPIGQIRIVRNEGAAPRYPKISRGTALFYSEQTEPAVLNYPGTGKPGIFRLSS